VSLSPVQSKRGTEHRAADTLLTVRPLAIPNRLVLRLALEEFLPHPLGQTLSKALVEEPRIRRNFVD